MFERFKQMDRQTVVGLIVAAVVGLLLFGAIAGVIRQAGWNEGFMFGLLAGNGEGAQQVMPYLTQRHGWGGHGWGGHPFGFVGGIFRFFFFIFLIMLVFKFLRFWRWRMHDGRHDWHGHHHSPWGRPGDGQPGQGNPAGESKAQNTAPQNTGWTNL